MKDFLKLCFKKNPVERPKAIHLLHHPWILKNEKTPHKSNSTILQNYLQKTTKQDDQFIMADYPLTIQKHAPSPSSTSPHTPYPSSSPMSSRTQQHQLDSSAIPPITSKFVSKLNQQSALKARQSMPIVANYQQSPPQQHVHDLIECSFPKGTVSLKQMQCRISFYILKYSSA